MLVRRWLRVHALRAYTCRVGKMGWSHANHALPRGSPRLTSEVLTPSPPHSPIGEWDRPRARGVVVATAGRLPLACSRRAAHRSLVSHSTLTSKRTTGQSKGLFDPGEPESQDEAADGRRLTFTLPPRTAASIRGRTGAWRWRSRPQRRDPATRAPREHSSSCPPSPHRRRAMTRLRRKSSSGNPCPGGHGGGPHAYDRSLWSRPTPQPSGDARLSPTCARGRRDGRAGARTRAAAISVAGKGF